MALGQQLISAILSEDVNKKAVKHLKGGYTVDRNYKIACRFYYHFTLVGLKYERCLEILNVEFNLSELRIAQLIMLERDSLSQLKKANTDRKVLQKKFPYFNWY
ncbi:hypothetical protein [uncultured Mucilaginibacter sp.]|uniref:hypothetical protein n=1 Tax=uncultured Mucilaginibacter sp. TaxID=797541 RepID=UPI0025D99B70|nr:hypothetical protein [uncultured Mucilaginibacter sp.]